MRSVFTMLFICGLMMQAVCQPIPAELMAGTRRTGLDILWFRKMQENKNEFAPWLFFHRTRVSVDNNNQTSFGVTNAVSYNFKSGIGFVAATQFLEGGFIFKGGLQYFASFHNGSLFTWLVTGKNIPGHFSGDWFVLARWTPPINKKLNFYYQAELLSQLDSKGMLILIQRLRTGIGKKSWQFGLATDFTAQGVRKLEQTINPGIFIRKEF